MGAPGMGAPAPPAAPSAPSAPPAPTEPAPPKPKEERKEEKKKNHSSAIRKIVEESKTTEEKIQRLKAYGEENQDAKVGTIIEQI